MEAPVSAFVHAARPVGGVALAVGDESEIEDALARIPKLWFSGG